MKKYALMIGLFMTFLMADQPEAAEYAMPSLRVLLAKESKGVLLEAKGGYKIIHRSTQKILSSGSSGKRFMAHAMSNGLRWGEEFPGIYGISIIPSEATTLFFVDGMQYQGPIHIYGTKKGFVNVVNEAPIEEFVRSVLSLKIATPTAPEAAAAMAIATRTNAYARLFSRKDENALWDISAKETGFLGMGVTLHNNGVEQAVDSTKYIVLEERAGIPMQNVNLALPEAEKLAAKGLDAKRILRSAVSQGEIGMINPLRIKRG